MQGAALRAAVCSRLRWLQNCGQQRSFETTLKHVRCAAEGILGQVEWPEGVRVDTWVETGAEVTPYYDSLLAKLMVYAPTREEAIAKLADALKKTKVLLRRLSLPACKHEKHIVCFRGCSAAQHAVSCTSRVVLVVSVLQPMQCHLWAQLKGIPTNLELCAAIAASEKFAKGDTTTAFLNDFPFSPHAVEVVAPGMNTTVQVTVSGLSSEQYLVARLSRIPS